MHFIPLLVHQVTVALTTHTTKMKTRINQMYSKRLIQNQEASVNVETVNRATIVVKIAWKEVSQITVAVAITA